MKIEWCQYCLGPMPDDARAQSRYCRDACRQGAYRERDEWRPGPCEDPGRSLAIQNSPSEVASRRALVIVLTATLCGGGGRGRVG